MHARKDLILRIALRGALVSPAGRAGQFRA